MLSEKELLNKWNNNTHPVVSICTITYNHEDYIAEAIESFLEQKTNFPFEILIHDDASTDNTQKIIKEYEKNYPTIIKPIYQTVNQKSIFKSGMNPRFNYPRVKGKYIATCEGDDYWIDPFKLQKQVDFLDNNADYGLICSNYKLLEDDHFKDSYLTTNCNFKNSIDINIETYLLKRYLVRTLTVMFKSKDMLSYFKDINDNLRYGFTFGDNILWSYLINKSRGKYIPDVTSVYRVISNSASHQTSIDKKRKHSKDIVLASYLLSKEFKLSRQLQRQLSLNIELLEMKHDVIDRKKTRVFVRFLKILLKFKKINKQMIRYMIIIVSNRHIKI